MPMTSEDLRDVLFSTLDDLRKDQCTPQKAQAIGKIAAQIINSVSMEIEFFKNVQKYADANASSPNTVLQLSQRMQNNVDPS